jgi:uncharacterized protein (DUF2062 family)
MGSYAIKRATRLSGTPHNVAAGVACGVAISFTPFMGFHLIGSFLLSALVRGNYLAAAIGTLVGNPWTFPFIWYLIYKFGRLLLGGEAVHFVPFHQLSLATLWADLERAFWPMTVGGLVLGAVAGLVTYFPLVRVVATYQAARARRREGRRQGRPLIKAAGTSPDTSMP